MYKSLQREEFSPLDMDVRKMRGETIARKPKNLVCSSTFTYLELRELDGSVLQVANDFQSKYQLVISSVRIGLRDLLPSLRKR